MDLYLNDLYSTLDLTHVSDSSLFIVGNFFFFLAQGLGVDSRTGKGALLGSTVRDASNEE